MTNSILQIKGLIDAKEPVLHGVHFNIGEGEVCGIVTEEKTAQRLAEILAGLRKPFSGTIEINGKTETFNSIRHAREKGIGIIFSGNQLMPNLTVGENIFFGTMNMFISRKKLFSKVQALIESVELNIDVNTYVSDLKEEEKLIVDFLRVLFQEPKIIVVMKLRGLTAKTFNTLKRIVNHCSRKNISFLFLSSRVDEIISIVDKVATIYQGEISRFITFEEIKRNPSDLVRLIIGQNVGDIQLDKDKSELELFNTIMKINQLITSKNELSEVFNFIAERLVKITRAQYCHIALFEQDSQKLQEEGSHKTVTHQLNNSAALRAVQTGEILFKNKINGEYIALKDYENTQVFSLFIPIKNNTQILGVMHIGFNELRLFNKELQNVLETFVYQASMAVENSRLMSNSNLIREAHHRIKNNLQSIVSLLLLESYNTKNEVVDSIIETTVSRIKAMAVVHEILSHRDHVSGMVNLRDLMVFLVDNMPEHPEKHGIKIEIDIKNYFIQYSKATSLILAINELIVNCIKHAFPEGFSGKQKTVSVHMKERKSGIGIIIEDNGVGLQQDAEKLKSTGLGMKIVDSLIRKDLNGKFEIRNSTDEKGEISGVIVTLFLDNQ